MPAKVVEKSRSSYRCRGLPWWLSDEEPICQGRRHGFNPWVGKIPWRRKWQPIQYSCVENPMDKRAWWATDYGITKSRTRLSSWTTRTVATWLQRLACPWHGGVLPFDRLKLELGTCVFQHLLLQRVWRSDVEHASDFRMSPLPGSGGLQQELCSLSPWQTSLQDGAGLLGSQPSGIFLLFSQLTMQDGAVTSMIVIVIRVGPVFTSV